MNPLYNNHFSNTLNFQGGLKTLKKFKSKGVAEKEHTLK
jgi:hypothetical protein